MVKEKIRTNLKMLEENLPNFNDYALQFIDPEETRKRISDWRWYVSHGYFKEDQRSPEFPASNPPLTWLHAQLQGQTTPLSKDIGLCIQPVVFSSIMTEGAARRIHDRLNMIWHHVSAEDAKIDQAARHKENIIDPAKRKAASEYEKQRRHAKEAEARKKTPEQLKKIEEDHVKKKEKQRKEENKRREQAKKEAQKKGQAARKKMEREMRQRRSEEFGVQA